jgi:hypothetical protein
MTENTLTVEESTHGIIPEGTTLTVHSDRTNQFSDRRVLTVSADCDIPNVVEGGRLQLHKMPEDSYWTEIHVGLKREHEKVKLA